MNSMPGKLPYLLGPLRCPYGFFLVPRSVAGAMLLFLWPVLGQGQEIDKTIAVQERQVGTNASQKYFLIQHKATATSTNKQGLILILPGGPGSRDFLPFCANVLTRYGFPEDFMAAELIALEWSKDENRIVWPSRIFPDKRAKFTSEEFLDAVIDDVGKSNRIDERFVFMLGWSSSGHVLYSASTSNAKVRGSLIAMSRFLSGKSVEAEQVRGKNYWLYHSPQDRVCAYSEAQEAENFLKEHGANVKLVSYEGGHGWVPNTFYCDRIMEGILWLKEKSTALQ